MILSIEIFMFPSIKLTAVLVVDKSVSEKKNIIQGHFRPVVHVEFDISVVNCSYSLYPYRYLYCSLCCGA